MAYSPYFLELWFSSDKQIFRIIWGSVYIIGEATCERGEMMIKHLKYYKENFVVAFASKKDIIDISKKW